MGKHGIQGMFHEAIRGKFGRGDVITGITHFLPQTLPLRRITIQEVSCKRDSGVLFFEKKQNHLNSCSPETVFSFFWVNVPKVIFTGNLPACYMAARFRSNL